MYKRFYDSRKYMIIDVTSWSTRRKIHIQNFVSGLVLRSRRSKTSKLVVYFPGVRLCFADVSEPSVRSIFKGWMWNMKSRSKLVIIPALKVC
jgi:hypothetical protein